MLANSIKYAEKVEESRRKQKKVEESRQVGKIKKMLTAHATEFIPSYYGESFAGGLLKPEAYRKRWDREEVIKTHSFIRRKIESYFGDIPTFWFTNRHGDYEDAEGNCKKGSFHTDLFIGEVPDEAVWNPSDALSVLIHKINQSGISINIKEVEIEALKQLLLRAISEKQSGQDENQNSLKLQKVPVEEFAQTFDYGLKDITNLDDFNQVFD